EHHAGGHDPRVRRPRRGPRRHGHRPLPRRPAGPRRPGRARHRVRRRGSDSGTRGRGEVRAELAGAAPVGRAAAGCVLVTGILDDVEAAAGLAVYGAGLVPGAAEVRTALIEAGVPGLLVAKDPTLWGPAAEAESKIRLGWVDTFRRSRELLPQLAELRSELSDLTHVVLAGMGGSSLAPEVISRTLGVPMTVLDTTDPHQVGAALRDRLLETVVVVASKSGGTVETDSHRRAYWQAFLDAGLSEAEAS